MHTKFIHTRLCVQDFPAFRSTTRANNPWTLTATCFRVKKRALELQLHPSIVFVVSELEKLLPTSNTCINQLNLPSQSFKLPNQNDLFKCYIIMRCLTSTLGRCNIMVLNSVFREKLIVTSVRFILRSHCVRYCQLVNPFF